MDRTFEIEFLEPGIRAYDFTFGPVAGRHLCGTPQNLSGRPHGPPWWAAQCFQLSGIATTPEQETII